MKYWHKLSSAEQDERITRSLKNNVDYNQKVCLGIPASKLDPYVFSDQASFLKDAPLLRCYAQNPNHIGCHTLGESEPFFKGTQEIEREVISLLSTDIFKAAEGSCDGYIASGGTEANIQAIWIYRNYFVDQMDVALENIGLLCSEDTHYSIVKAANLLSIKLYQVKVDDHSRSIIPEQLDITLKSAVENGVKCFIVVANMGTTMFGSIDAPELYTEHLKKYNLPFKLHIDGAFGGFVYPISNSASSVNFENPDISSITLDAHKMLQAPYGTGIFLVRKGYMQYALTEAASYVNGMDITLSGSRSGTNAVAIWMILMTYGPFGWLEKINKLLYRTNCCCRELDKLGVQYYRHPKMNIIAIRSSYINPEIAERFGLVPDTHDSIPNWYKIVVMDHVELHHLEEFIWQLEKSLSATTSPL